MFSSFHGLLVDDVPPASPPAWPAAFEASFTEFFEGFPVAPSTGRWYYQYDASAGGAKNWRVDHMTPQHNNFCACAQPGVTETCELYFAIDGMYVNFPSLPTDDACCRLCTSESGCSPLKPDWLSGNDPTRTGVDLIGGRQCYQYCTPGAQFLDCMSYDAAGVPCRYSESWSPTPAWRIVHNLTFTSWTNQLRDASVFTLPNACQKPCPRQFPACMTPSE
ncbi:Aste57867_14245 [Aphanomyces stellatus]|uniref:Aste57867_14245 protein n=1 Tax=Aphanomyces stellatus TaxID=120398 RepID=A0A485L0H2_9STRA|nr:hypothetical protein As57867_014194 [Aphanomyces stellatus]VFT91070.1 Aste57867_14245 [Aphanomyces stellatus]